MLFVSLSLLPTVWLLFFSQSKPTSILLLLFLVGYSSRLCTSDTPLRVSTSSEKKKKKDGGTRRTGGLGVPEVSLLAPLGDKKEGRREQETHTTEEEEERERKTEAGRGRERGSLTENWIDRGRE